MWLSSRSCQRRLDSSKSLLPVMIAAITLAIVPHVSWAQSPPNIAPQPIGSQNVTGSGLPSSTAQPESPAPPSPPTPDPPAGSIESLGRRIDALAQNVSALALAAEAPAVDPRQDSKSVILNVLSNRIDAWLFGQGNESVGLVAQAIAIGAFVVAWIKLGVALVMLHRKPSANWWGKLRAFIREHWFVRWSNLFFAVLALIFTGAALYVVLTARASTMASDQSVAALQKTLMACQATLATAVLPPPQDRSTVEAMAGYAKACEAAIHGTDLRLVGIEGTVTRIANRQPGVFSRFVGFIAALYLIGCVSVLTWRAVVE